MPTRPSTRTETSHRVIAHGMQRRILARSEGIRPAEWPPLANARNDPLQSPLQRVRSAVRSTLLGGAVPVMGTFLGGVDESATGSLNLLPDQIRHQAPQT